MRRIILLGSVGLLLLAGQLGLGQQAPCSAGKTWEKTAYGGYCKPNGGEGVSATQRQEPVKPNEPPNPATDYITEEMAAKLTDQELRDKTEAKMKQLNELNETVGLAQPDQITSGPDRQAYNTVLTRAEKNEEVRGLVRELYNRLVDKYNNLLNQVSANDDKVYRQGYDKGWSDGIVQALRIVESNRPLTMPSYVPAPSVQCHTEYDGAYGLNTVCQ
jgi:hypothetical protein